MKFKLLLDLGDGVTFPIILWSDKHLTKGDTYNIIQALNENLDPEDHNIPVLELYVAKGEYEIEEVTS